MESKQQILAKVKELGRKIAFHESQAAIHEADAEQATKELEEYLDYLGLGTRAVQKVAEEKKREARRQIMAAGVSRLKALKEPTPKPKGVKVFDQALIDETKEDILAVLAVGGTPRSITSIARDINHSPAVTKIAMLGLVNDGQVVSEGVSPDAGPPFTGYKAAG